MARMHARSPAAHSAHQDQPERLWASNIMPFDVLHTPPSASILGGGLLDYRIEQEVRVTL
jgi:hypothetical protein